MALRCLAVLLAMFSAEAARVRSVRRSQRGSTRQDRPQLKFPASGEGFKILQIADTQIRAFSTDFCWNVPWGHWRRSGCSAETTIKFIQRLVEDEKPDMVVFTGDNINGSPDGVEVYRRVFEPVIAAKIPFAAIFGNHDEEGQLNRRQMIDYISSQPYSLASPGPDFESDHIGNYMLQIQGSNSSAAAFNLWFVDSGSYAPWGSGYYDWIQEDQIAWYREQSEQSEQAAGRKLDSIAFFHIPTPEWVTASSGPIVGDFYEGIAAPTFNSGMLPAMKARGDVRVAAVGHDHINDWCGVWQGIDLCYGGGAGYTTYGKSGFDRRARVYMVHEDGAIDTWKRLDDEGFSKIDEMRLNGTFGADPTLRAYRGSQSVTRSGKTCQKWTSQYPHPHSRTEANYAYSGLGDHNECRNPDGEPTIWCYTESFGSRVEYCDPEGLDAKLQGYRGTQNVTRSGKSCQKWSAQSPHVHTRTAGLYPAYGLGDHNYCRNPDGEPTLWCFTTDSESRWEFCDVPAEASSTSASARGCELPAKPTTGRRPEYCAQ